VNAAELGDILVATAKPCGVDSYQSCRRFLAGTLNTEAAVQYIVRGGHGMKNEQVGSAALPEIASTTTNGGSVNAQACGCGGKGLPADGQAAPVQREDEEMEETTRPAIAPGATRSNRTTKASQATGDGVLPSCECEDAGPLVYALGQIGYDLRSDARRDGFVNAMNEVQKPGQPTKSPYNPEDLLTFLRSEDRYYKAFIPAVTWTLNVDGTPIYALRPDGTFARETYETVLDFYSEQIHKESDRAAFPGTLKGSARLYSGQVVPVICPELRGMANWKTKQVVEASRKALLAKRAKVPEEKVKRGEKRAEFPADEVDLQLTNFLDRIYFELRNMGQSPQERAINYSATNAFVAAGIMMVQASLERQLDTIEVEKSPICRLDSDCWDVKLVFFDTKNVLAPRTVARFTVDVSDVLPVLVGDPRIWEIR
jgi:cyanobactin maturation PatA/PatG family protease